jgi:DNA-binding NarL/FixJ family response regulator
MTLHERYGHCSHQRPLPPRQEAIVQHLAQGDTTRTIAEQLGLSIKTVETHYQYLRHKWHLATAAQLRVGAVLYVLEQLARSC